MNINLKLPRVGLAAAAIAGALAVVAAPAAHADLIITLSVANANLATQGPGPYATYDISLITSTEFKVVATGENNFVFGDHDIVDFNLSTTATLCTAASSTCVAAPTITLSQAAAGQVDGFGTFNFRLDDDPGFSSPHSTFTFYFDTSVAETLASLFTNNASGADAAGHLALATNTACTGFAANAGSSDSGVDNSSCTATRVPEPASLAIFGTALGGLGLIRRRRKSA